MTASDYDRLFNRFRHENDGDALARLFDLLAPDLLRLARSLTGRHGAAEDLVQATFLTAIEKRHRYRTEGRFFGWLAGILVNELRRERGRNARRPDPHRLAVGESPAADHRAERDEMAGELRQALDAMPEPYRGVLELKLTQDLAPDEIAGRLGRKPGTVRAQLHRGLALMRRVLPAGLASVFFTLLPTGSALGAVRSVVRDRAIEAVAVKATTVAGSGMAAGVGVAAAGKGKALALAAVAVIAIAPLVYVWRQSDEDAPALDEAGGALVQEESPAVRREPAAGPRPTDPEGETPVAVAEKKADAPRPRKDSSQVVQLAPIVDGKSTRAAAVYLAAIPEGLTGNELGSLPLSTIADEFRFVDAAHRLEGVAGPRSTLRHESWTELLALVGVEDSNWLFPKVLAGRWVNATVYERPSRWIRDPKIAVRRLEAKKDGPRIRDVHLRLWTKEGVAEVAAKRDGKNFRVEGLIPARVDLRLVYSDGGERIVAWDLARPSKMSHVSRGVATRIEVVDAQSGARIPEVRIAVFSRRHPQAVEALSLETGGSDPVIKTASKEYDRLVVYARAEGHHARVSGLRWLRLPGDDGMSVMRIELYPRKTRRGRLLDEAGAPVADAFVTVRSLAGGYRLLLARSDETGRLDWQARGLGGQGRPMTSVIKYRNGEVAVEVREVEGPLALVSGYRLHELLDGKDVRLERGSCHFRLRVTSAEGKALNDVSARVRLPGRQDAVHFGPTSREGQSDHEGLVDLDRLRAEEVVVTLRRPGAFPHTEVVRLPAGAEEYLHEISWPAVATIRGRVEGLRDEVRRGLSLRLHPAGADPLDRTVAMMMLRVEEDDTFCCEVPRDGQFDLRASARAMGRTPFGLQVLTPLLSGLEGDTEDVLVRVRALHRVPIEVQGPEGAVLSRADIRWTEDQDTTLDPWSAMQRGVGGYWSKQTARLSLPLGASSVTVVAPGHRAQTRSIAVENDEESLVFRLEKGPVLRGRVEPGTDRVMFSLIEVEGVTWPERWTKSAQSPHAYSRIVDVTPDGSFVTPPLTPGRWELIVGAETRRTLRVRNDADLGLID